MQRLIDGTQRLLGLVLTPQQRRAFQLYYQELVTWNARFNLTAITDLEGVQVRHFLDSLSCLLAIGDDAQGQSLIDVGSGAGFPGFPLKIVYPTLRLVLLEATSKKTDFLRHMVALLELRNVTVIHSRAEKIGQDPLDGTGPPAQSLQGRCRQGQLTQHNEKARARPFYRAGGPRRRDRQASRAGYS